MSEMLTSYPYTPTRRASLAGVQPITDLMSRALENPDLISLAAGFVDQETLPVEAVQAVASDLLANVSESRAALQYGTTAGLPALREQLLDQVEAAKQPALKQVIVTAGSNQLLHLVAETLLDPGDVVLCAAPTYLVFLGIVANLDARAYGIATDDQGMIPAALAETLRQFDERGELSRVKAIYLVPYFDNPSGITMSQDRLAEIVELAKCWSRESKIHVITDEAYRELRYAGEDVPSALAADADGDTVVVAGTFSKSFSPGLRVGWGVLPEHLVEPLLAQKGNFDFGSPNINQHLMARILDGSLFHEQVARLRESYSAKMAAMLEACDEYLRPIEGVTWRVPTGGLYVWAQMPGRVATGPQGELFECAIQEGVLYVPGEYCFAAEGEPIEHNTMRLSFGVQSCDRIREGIKALATAVRFVSEQTASTAK
jgi:2-aminoadipate transaminase